MAGGGGWGRGACIRDVNAAHLAWRALVNAFWLTGTRGGEVAACCILILQRIKLVLNATTTSADDASTLSFGWVLSEHWGGEALLSTVDKWLGLLATVFSELNDFAATVDG